VVTKEETMDDKFLHELRDEPRPEFAAGLRARLARQEASGPRRAGWSALRWSPAAVAATVLAAVGLLFAFPSVRVSAQAFLDSFRVRNFTAVSVDENRLKQLDSEELDLKRLIGDQFKTLEDPGPPKPFPTPEAAGAAAGIPVRQPVPLPAGLTLSSVQVAGEAAVQVTADTRKLDRVMDALEIRDLRVPASLDGQTATLRMAPTVRLAYTRGDQEVRLFQGRSPEVSLPAGVDLAMLGEIGLRIVGIEASEAHRLAQAIDWRGTLIVPVPTHATSFREVDVRGARGLLIESTAPSPTRPGGRRRDNLLLWSDGGQVYALGGQLSTAELLEMANTVR
jgi:hypothetical protein